MQVGAQAAPGGRVESPGDGHEIDHHDRKQGRDDQKAGRSDPKNGESEGSVSKILTPSLSQLASIFLIKLIMFRHFGE